MSCARRAVGVSAVKLPPHASALHTHPCTDFWAVRRASAIREGGCRRRFCPSRPWSRTGRHTRSVAGRPESGGTSGSDVSTGLRVAGA
eukprot:2668145-Rhodomonas_salina.1